MTSCVCFVFATSRLPAWAASPAFAITAAIASAITAAGTTAAGASSASAIAATIGAGTSFVHGDCPPTEIGSVQGLDSGIGLRAVGHFDEAESPQAPAELIAEGEVSNVDIQERCPSFRK